MMIAEIADATSIFHEAFSHNRPSIPSIVVFSFRDVQMFRTDLQESSSSPEICDGRSSSNAYCRAGSTRESVDVEVTGPLTESLV